MNNELMKPEISSSLSELLHGVRVLEPHRGYYYSVHESLLIMLLGSFCGLRDMKLVLDWAETPSNAEFLRDQFGIHYIPSYSWFMLLLRLVDSASLNEHFTKWVSSHLPAELEGQTLSVDGKTVRSTSKMKGRTSPLHIVSAQLSELGLTFGQLATADKSNEIPTVQELLKTLKIKGLIVAVDALNCQKETAKIIVDKGGDY